MSQVSSISVQRQNKNKLKARKFRLPPQRNLLHSILQLSSCRFRLGTLSSRLIELLDTIPALDSFLLCNFKLMRHIEHLGVQHLLVGSEGVSLFLELFHALLGVGKGFFESLHELSL